MSPHEDDELARALRRAAQAEVTPDVSEAVAKRLAAESRQGGVGYVVVQVVLVAALLGGAVWWLLRG